MVFKAKGLVKESILSV